LVNFGAGGQPAVGFVSDTPLVSDETYTFVARESTFPEVSYNDLAATYVDATNIIASGTGFGNDTIDGGAGDDTIFGEGGNDTIAGGTGDDVIFGDSGANAGLNSDGTQSITSVSGAEHTVVLWDLSDVNFSGGTNPFPASSSGVASVAGTTFTLGDGASPVALGINDSIDNEFSDSHTGQTLAQATTVNGISGNSSTIVETEYAYSVTDSSGACGRVCLRRAP